MQRILVADSSETFVDALCGRLCDLFEIKRCNDGRDVITLLRDFQPDLLLLDLMLPGCDGLTILESICALEERPVILVVSRVFGYYIQGSMDRLGISYAMQKPCDVDAVCNRIRDLAQYPKSQLFHATEAEEIVRGMLHAMGFSSKHIGYHCLVEAICSIAKKPYQLYTKELYPAVGKIFGCNWRQVERDIRTAIDSAWETGEAIVWQEFFPRCTNKSTKPTNSALISTLGQLLNKTLQRK